MPDEFVSLSRNELMFWNTRLACWTIWASTFSSR